MKEGRILRTLRHPNTRSTGMLQPYSEIIYEGNESREVQNSKNSVHQFKNSWNHNSSIPKFVSNTTGRKSGGNKTTAKFRNDYLKKNKRMHNLSSTGNLKKHLSSSKSFSSLHSKQPSKLK